MIDDNWWWLVHGKNRLSEADKKDYDFEKQLRNDPRWLKTQNAQQSIMDMGLQVARDMGVAY